MPLRLKILQWTFLTTGKWTDAWPMSRLKRRLSVHWRWSTSSVNILPVKFHLRMFVWQYLKRFLISFQGIVQGDTIEEVYSKVKQLIWSQAGPVIWVASKESLWQSDASTWTLPPRVKARPVSRNQCHWTFFIFHLTRHHHYKNQPCNYTFVLTYKIFGKPQVRSDDSKFEQLVDSVLKNRLFTDVSRRNLKAFYVSQTYLLKNHHCFFVTYVRELSPSA